MFIAAANVLSNYAQDGVNERGILPTISQASRIALEIAAAVASVVA